MQRGAVRPLIEMLQSSDIQLKEMSAFALGRLAQVSNFLPFCLSQISTCKMEQIDKPWPIGGPCPVISLSFFSSFFSDNGFF